MKQLLKSRCSPGCRPGSAAMAKFCFGSVEQPNQPVPHCPARPDAPDHLAAVGVGPELVAAVQVAGVLRGIRRGKAAPVNGTLPCAALELAAEAIDLAPCLLPAMSLTLRARTPLPNQGQHPPQPPECTHATWAHLQHHLPAQPVLKGDGPHRPLHLHVRLAAVQPAGKGTKGKAAARGASGAAWTCAHAPAASASLLASPCQPPPPPGHQRGPAGKRLARLRDLLPPHNLQLHRRPAAHAARASCAATPQALPPAAAGLLLGQWVGAVGPAKAAGPQATRDQASCTGSELCGTPCCKA